MTDASIPQPSQAENPPDWGPQDEIRYVEDCRSDLPAMLATHDAAVKKITEALPPSSYSRCLTMHLRDIREDMIDRSNWDDEKFYQFRVIKGWPEQNWGDPEVDGVNEKDFPRHRMEWLAAVLRDSYLLYSILETPNPDMEAGWSFERNLPRNLRRAAEVLHIVYQLQNELLDFLEGELAKKPDIAAAA